MSTESIDATCFSDSPRAAASPEWVVASAADSHAAACDGARPFNRPAPFPDPEEPAELRGHDPPDDGRIRVRSRSSLDSTSAARR